MWLSHEVFHKRLLLAYIELRLLNKKKYEETKTDLKELAALFYRYNISKDALNEIDTYT